jgi:hypothetical protein
MLAREIHDRRRSNRTSHTLLCGLPVLEMKLRKLQTLVPMGDVQETTGFSSVATRRAIHDVGSRPSLERLGYHRAVATRRKKAGRSGPGSSRAQEPGLHRGKPGGGHRHFRRWRFWLRTAHHRGKPGWGRRLFGPTMQFGAARVAAGGAAGQRKRQKVRRFSDMEVRILAGSTLAGVLRAPGRSAIHFLA